MKMIHRNLHKIQYVLMHIRRVLNWDATVEIIIKKYQEVKFRYSNLKLILKSILFSSFNYNSKRFVRVVLNMEVKIKRRIQTSHNCCYIERILAFIEKVTQYCDRFSNRKFLIGIAAST